MTKLEELKLELENLRKSNLSAWESYGSELCAGEMIANEKKLENQIKELEDVSVE